MKIIKINREEIHRFIASKYTKSDGEQLMWFIGKENEEDGYCIFSACGSTIEIKNWLDSFMKEMSETTRKKH